jgi:mono/diheme cytochrome c family protein
MKRISKMMFKTRNIGSIGIAFGIAVILAGCAAKGNHTGREYAANMYHSVAYEPMSQITDEDAGAWVNALEGRSGEYFNSNRYNPFRMTMRVPPKNVVKRNKHNWLPYHGKYVAKDSVPIVTAGLRSPLDTAANAAIIAQGKFLFDTYCDHCHGSKGAADGKVADKVAGVANLTGDAYLGITEGHIFHVVTYGAGLMGAHGSQITPEDRWKIARYVKTTIQKK